MYLDDQGKLRMCGFEQERNKSEKIRQQRRGVKKLLNLAEDLMTKYVFWQQRHLLRKIRKTYLPAILTRLERKSSM